MQIYKNPRDTMGNETDNTVDSETRLTNQLRLVVDPIIYDRPIIRP